MAPIITPPTREKIPTNPNWTNEDSYDLALSIRRFRITIMRWNWWAFGFYIGLFAQLH